MPRTVRKFVSIAGTAASIYCGIRNNEWGQMVPSCHNVATLVAVCYDVTRTTEIISRPFAFRAAPAQSPFLSIESRENHRAARIYAVHELFSTFIRSLIGSLEFSTDDSSRYELSRVYNASSMRSRKE